MTSGSALTPENDARAARVRAFALPWGAPAIMGLFVAWIALTQLRAAFELWPGISTWYPPAALLISACIIWGPRAVIPIFAAALIVGRRFIGPANPWWEFAPLSLVLKLVYAAAALVLARLGFDGSFSRPRDVSLFAGAVVVAALLASAIGTTAGLLDGTIASSVGWRAMLVFWLGDVVAILALSPGLLTIAGWWARRAARQPAARPASVRRDLLLVLSVPVTLWLAFGFAPRLGFPGYAICFIPLGLTALTRGVRGAALMTAALDIGAVLLLHWTGAMPRDNLEVQVFMTSLAVTGLFLGSVADERERGRVLLAESEERYRALIDMLPDPLVVHRDGVVLFANPTAAQTFGVASPMLLVGRNLRDLADSASQTLVQTRIKRLASGESLEVAEHRFQRLDGTGHVDLEASSTPIPYADGPAALTVARDITERRRLEGELRHSQRMESVGRLAGGVAHDFNNLLTVIISNSQLLLEEKDIGALAREYAQETLDAAGRAAALTRQLLTFSRKQVLQPKPVHLNSVVGDAEKLIRRLLGADIALTVTLGPDAGIVLADPTQLDQVIVNLAVNARDAMPDGGTLVVETGGLTATGNQSRWPSLTAGRHAMLIVRDTGSGMSESVRARIFDPFYTTKGESSGTGLGLATVYGIVTQAGGSIFVESEVGTGTQFTIFLPEQAVNSVQPGVAPAGGEATGTRSSAGTRVLLAEDDAAIRQCVERLEVVGREDDSQVRAAMRRTLAAAGYTVIEAPNGEAALEAYGRADPPIDIVVTDMSMPRMSGRDLARTLRSRGDRVPVVLVSGFFDPREDVAIERLTVHQKPIDGDALVAAIEAALRAR